MKNNCSVVGNVATITNDHCIQCGERLYTDYFCLECRDSGDRFSIPKPKDFLKENNHEVDYLISGDLARIGANLMINYKEDFASLLEAETEIDFFWKRKGGTSRGAANLGKCVKVSGALKYYSDKDFIIWLAADHCKRLDYYCLTACVFHQLKYAWKRVTALEDKTSINAPDFLGFASEIKIFGAWRSEAALMKKAFDVAPQPKLF